jgi:hypothetical protein
MTNPYRVFFREVMVPPPDGFCEVLRMRLPAKISIGTGVTIWSQPPKSIYNIVDCKFNLDKDTISALDFLLKGPFFFPNDPHFDPLERLLVPGAGAEFRNELIDNARIDDPEDRRICHAVLENYILPIHEAEGHVEINLSAEKSCFESRTIWLQLQQCLKCPSMNEYLDYPATVDEDILFQHYLSLPMHELYALIKEETAWKRFAEQTDFQPATNKLKGTIRAKQDSLVVKLLKFLNDKSGNDMAKVSKVVEELVIKPDLSLSHFMPHFIRDLARGVEIDNIVDFALELTSKKFSAQYSRSELDRAMKDQRQWEHELRSDPAMKAVLTTYMSLSYSESALTISFYSQENGEYSIRTIPNLVILREAKKILDRRGLPYPISPLQSMEHTWTSTLEEIADGKFKDRRDGPIYNFDVLKDFGNFYRTWRPALLEAQKRVLGKGNSTNA